MRYGGVRTAARFGASARRAVARDGALSRERKRARLPRHLRGESPQHPLPLRRGTARSFTLSVLVPRILASLGLGRSAWRAEGAPLKP